MKITLKEAKNILTAQKGGFLSVGPYPFTHSLSGYIGCGFGQTTCGMYCYAQYMPNWMFAFPTEKWGQAILVKENAAKILDQKLASMRADKRRQLRIFMSSTTDPYQPAELQYQITKQCLEVFTKYTDLDLLVIQTRSSDAARDFALMQQIPYCYLSVTIETNDQKYLKNLKGGPFLNKRWDLVRNANLANIATQITVSPCLHYDNVEEFSQQLIISGAKRIVVDTLTSGDGLGGQRTQKSAFAIIEPNWADSFDAKLLYNTLLEKAPSTVSVGWSSHGFAGIPTRDLREKDLQNTD